MSKYTVLVLVLLVGAYSDIWAQERGNPLLTEILDKIQQLQREITQLRNRNELTQHELKTLRKNLDEKLTELKAQPDTRHTTSTASLTSAPTMSETDESIQLRNDFQKLDLKLIQMDARIDELVRAVKALETKLSRLPETPAAEPQQPAASQPKEDEETILESEPETIPTKPAEVPAMKPAVSVDQNEYAAYSRAIDALDRADYTRLRDNLIRFLQDYPDGDYADDANYWVAESYYAEGDLEPAESYFTQLIENYGNSEKREPALLKIAYIRLGNQQWDAARKILEQLQNEAVDEQIRKLATEQLEQLENKGH